MPILSRPSELAARRTTTTTAAAASGCRPASAAAAPGRNPAARAAAATTGRRTAPVVAAPGRATDALPALKPSQAGVKKASSAIQKTTRARLAAAANSRAHLPDASRTLSPASSAASAASTTKSWAPWKDLKHVNVFAAAGPSPTQQARRRAATAKAKAEAAEKSMLFSMSSLKDMKSAHEVQVEGRRAHMRSLGPAGVARR